MKKKLLIFALVLVVTLGISAILWAGIANVTSDWVDGNLIFYDGSGNAIFKYDATNRAVEIPAGSAITQLAHKVATIAMTQVDRVLSAAEYICNLLIVTGSPSGKSIIVPTPTVSAVAVLYTVRNAGGDSADVVIKTATGTSVTVGSGKTAEVYCTSTGCYRKTADATH